MNLNLNLQSLIECYVERKLRNIIICKTNDYCMMENICNNRDIRITLIQMDQMVLFQIILHVMST